MLYSNEWKSDSGSIKRLQAADERSGDSPRIAKTRPPWLVGWSCSFFPFPEWKIYISLGSLDQGSWYFKSLFKDPGVTAAYHGLTVGCVLSDIFSYILAQKHLVPIPIIDVEKFAWNSWQNSSGLRISHSVHCIRWLGAPHHVFIKPMKKKNPLCKEFLLFVIHLLLVWTTFSSTFFIKRPHAAKDSGTHCTHSPVLRPVSPSPIRL